ncbi:heat shock protein 67B1 [Alosa alosa]|nr:heat shock protein 67B1 [Alosa alosa]
MADSSTKSSNRPQYCRDATWYPLRTGWQPSYMSTQNFGLSPLLTPGDLSWMESVSRKLAALSWPGYMWCTQPCTPTHPKLQREIWGRAAEVRGEPYRWTVSLDVNHFFPTELSVRITEDGFLEISGKHEERQDEHGFISRSFTRKYKLPIGIESQTIRSSLSGDGILMVEASLPKIPQPQMFIPVQIEKEPRSPGTVEKKEDPRTEREGQCPPFASNQRSPTSPTRPVWEPKEANYLDGRQADHALAEFSSGPFASQSRRSNNSQAGEDVGEADTQEGGAREEAQDQFTDLSEAPATPDTLTSEQEECGDGVQDSEVQKQQDQQQLKQQQQLHGETTGESHEEGGLPREGSEEEVTSGEQAPESRQFQELVIPEQEVLESHMSQEQEAQ